VDTAENEILSGAPGLEGQQVILPDLTPAVPWRIWPKSARWKTAGNSACCGLKPGEILPLTYMKFDGCDQRPSAVNVADWSAPRPTPAGHLSGHLHVRGKILFLPDQHLGRNTALRWVFR